MKRILLSLFSVLLFAVGLMAQCNFPFAPGVNSPEGTPVFCQGIDDYCSTLPASGSSTNLGGCENTTIENTHYLKFVAGSDFVELEINPSNCSGIPFVSAGMEAALYLDGAQNPIAIQCNGTPNSFSLTAFVDIGKTYLLLLDGKEGSVCDYNIQVLDGSTVAPDFSGQGLSFTGPLNIQQNVTYTFSTDFIEGAEYNWEITGGTIVSGAGTNQVDIQVTSDFYFAISTQAVGSCSATSSFGQDYIVDPAQLNEINETVCEGECFEFSGTSYCSAGVYDVVVDEDGELINYRIFLTVIPTTETFVQAEVCSGVCYSFDGEDYCNPGFYTIVLNSSEGCDSIVNLQVTASDLTVLIDGATELDCQNTSATLTAISSGANSYLWTGPGVTDITQSNQSIFINLPGIYTLSVTNEFGCTAETSVEIIGAAGDPVITISGNEPINCNNYQTTLTASVQNSGASYSWTGPNGETAAGASITTNILGTYIVEVTTLAGCSSSESIIVFENNAPLFVDPGPNRHIQCEFILDLEAPGAAGNNVQYQWTTINGNIINGANTLNPRVNQSGFYTLTATDLDNGCSGSAMMEVYSDLAIIENENLEITCDITSVQIDASESYAGDDVDIQWSTATGNFVSGTETLTPTVDAPGVYQILISRPACISFASITVADNAQAPNIALSASAENITCDDFVTLNAVVDPANSEFAWYLNGEVVSTDASFIVDTPGEYILEATGSNNCSGSESINVGIDQDPNGVTISGDLELDCGLNGTGTLEVSINGTQPFYEVEWLAFNGGEIINTNIEVNQSTIFGAGTYCVEITNPANGCVVLECVDIQEINLIELNGTVADVSCPSSTDGSISLSPTDGVAPYTYDWSNGENQSSIFGLAPGTYTVTATDANGCNAFQGFTVEVGGTEDVLANAGTDQALDCSISFIVLDGGSSVFPPDGMVEWTTLNGNIVSGANTTSLSVDSPGTYTITVSSPDGCVDSDQVLVSEYVANAGPSRTIDCNNSSIELIGLNAQNGATYNWTTTDGNIVSGANTLSPSVNSAGTYTLEVTLGSGCTYSDDTTVDTDFATPDLSVVDDEIFIDQCIDPVTLEAMSNTPGVTFSWSGPEGTTSNNITFVFLEGVYTVTATAPNGCTSSAEVNVIDFTAPPSINVNQNQYINCFNGDPLLLEVDVMSASGSTTVTWSGFNGEVLEQIGNNALVNQADTYLVFAVDNFSGCESSTFIDVEEQQAEIEIATTIASCGIPDAEATVTTTYIHEPEFLWSTGATTATVSGLGPDTYTVTITSPQSTCDEVRTIEVVQDPSCFVVVSGYIYDDADLSCDDGGDASPKADVIVHIMPEELVTTSDENGYYEFLVPPGDYTVEPQLVSPFVVECPSENIQVSVPAGSSGSENNNFYVKALSGFDLYLTGGSGNANAGNNQNYQLTFCNNGFTTIFGTLEFTHDPALTFDWQAAGADSYDEASNTAVFEFSNFSFFACEYMSFQIAIPDDLPHGTILTTTARVLPTQGDFAPQNNTITWTKSVNNNNPQLLNQSNNQTAIESSFSTAMINSVSQYPNPFTKQTTLKFQLVDAQDVEVQIFDVAGRLMKSYTGFENGWNKLTINGDDLNGRGLYLYRIIGEDEVVSGRMIRE